MAHEGVATATTFAHVTLQSVVVCLVGRRLVRQPRALLCFLSLSLYLSLFLCFSIVLSLCLSLPPALVHPSPIPVSPVHPDFFPLWRAVRHSREGDRPRRVEQWSYVTARLAAAAP